MIRFILDSSVALKWVITEVDSDKAIGRRLECVNGLCQFLAPDVFPIEVAHSLTRAERQNRIGVGFGLPHWIDVMYTPLQLVDSQPLIKDAINISSRFQAGVYDCLYVVLAQRESCEFITADDKLAKKLSGHFSFIRTLSSFP